MQLSPWVLDWHGGVSLECPWSYHRAATTYGLLGMRLAAPGCQHCTQMMWRGVVTVQLLQEVARATSAQ